MSQQFDIKQYRISEQPYYQPQANEVTLYEAAYAARLPVMLKGPTGCGKSRFVEHMAWKLEKPLITVACNEDMTASDLVGRYLLDANGTRWLDGPLTLAARHGAICYLDEVVEARQDTTVVIHPLTDHRRTLPLDKKGELVAAHPDFQLVISYNPGYQSLMKDLKQSTKQRFAAMEFDYPSANWKPPLSARKPGLMPRRQAVWCKLGWSHATSRDMVWTKEFPPACWCMRPPLSTVASPRATPAAWRWCARSPMTRISAIRWIMRLTQFLSESGRVGTPLCPRGFITAWADKIPAHPTQSFLLGE